MQRDQATGRFMKGNTASIGNKGNRNPKWGNKNAVKHGLYETVILPKILDNGNLSLIKMNPIKGFISGYILHSSTFHIDEIDKGFWINTDVIQQLNEKGLQLTITDTKYFD
ncbi:hypothetical protein ABEO79_00235 [Micromonospora provocatoris]